MILFVFLLLMSIIFASSFISPSYHLERRKFHGIDKGKHQKISAELWPKSNEEDDYSVSELFSQEEENILLPTLVSRRSVLALSSSVILATSPGINNVATAAPPMTVGESDNLGARAERAMRGKPPKILRQKLNQDFAVLLMRSSYNALDQLDCVAMVRLFCVFLLFVSCSCIRVIAEKNLPFFFASGSIST